MSITVIPNFLDEKELMLLNTEIEKGKWELGGTSNSKEVNPLFWYKDIINTDAFVLIHNKLKVGLGLNLKIVRLYINGQAHGQCGDWHKDIEEGINCFTLVYFFKKWLPEYGGHLLIREADGKVNSYLPEFNKGIILDSTLEHMGLEPTMHCKTQRESLACKFHIIS